MRNVTLPGAALHCKSTAPAAGFQIILARRNESGVQRLVDLRIDRGQPAVDTTKEVTFVEHRAARCIAVYDQAIGVDQKDRGAQTVENIGESGRFGLAEIDDLAGPNRAPNMRHDETHAATHFIINHTARFVPHHAEIGAACCGFFQHGICRIDPALWLRPFPVEAPCPKLVIGNEIRDAEICSTSQSCRLATGSNFQ